METDKDKKVKAASSSKTKMLSTTNKNGNKRSMPSQSGEDGIQRRPKRAASCIDFKEKTIRFSLKSDMVETKKERIAEDEMLAIHMTAGKDDDEGPNRRLVDFILHDSDGVPRSFEMSEVDDLYITGLILPLEECAEKQKGRDTGVRCGGFGRIESWSISGYEDGSPVVWISTDIADYECIKPAATYKKFYDHFYEKANACVEVYKKLSTSSGGHPDCSLDELLAAVVRAMTGRKCFSNGSYIKDFIFSQGEFIYNQLIGLDDTSKNNERLFCEMPALLMLRDECINCSNTMRAQEGPSGKALVIGSRSANGEKAESEDDEDVKLSKLLQEEEYWHSMKKNKKKGRSSFSGGQGKFYIKINEDEIANDYPLPAYYKNDELETDEFIIFDNELTMVDIDDLPQNMLNGWSLYDSDSRMISLELLPMRPCEDIDVTIFGSGIMTADDGSGFFLDTDGEQSSSSASRAQRVDGISIYISAIKEWMIEFGSSMVFISIRTDVAWYRLGEPSKRYAPWYKPVIKTARVAISIITLLKEQARVSRLSFPDVMRKVAEFDKSHLAYISSNVTDVERYIVVHGQIILQLFAEYPDQIIRNCPFVSGLVKKMEERHHTKWLVKKKKKILQKLLPNLNPRAGVGPSLPRKKAMQATTTRLINRIWGEYYSNYSPEDLKEGTCLEVKEEDETEEPDENEDDIEETVVPVEVQEPSPKLKLRKTSSNNEARWVGDSIGKNSSGEALYRRAIVHGEQIDIGSLVLLEVDESDDLSVLYYVEYMYEASKGSKVIHGRMMKPGCETVLGNAANERELFLTNGCADIALGDIRQKFVLDIRSRPWGHQHRKNDATADAIDRTQAEERKKKGLPLEFYCKSLYSPENGAFFSLPFESMGLGSGTCYSCDRINHENGKADFKINSTQTGFTYEGNDYSVHGYVYVSPHCFSEENEGTETFKGGRNVGLKAYVVCQLLKILAPKETKKADALSTKIEVRRFFRPEDISSEKAYYSDIREVYYSEDIQKLAVNTIKGKCEVRKKSDIPLSDTPTMFQHIFFCERLYDPIKGSLKQLPAHIKVRYSVETLEDDAAIRKRKGKGIKFEDDSELAKQREEAFQSNSLSTLDIFAGCGGLSEGLQKAGVCATKWAIEYEEPAADAFKLNHPHASLFVNNCNVILRAIMQKCGDIDDCISTPEATELAAKLDEKENADLPLPGQVDFINGGPPCQGFSGLNRFSQSTWSKVQCEMILAFLSFAEYFRPKYFLLENVRNFVSFNKGQTFRLTLASLLEMGYQVRFGILEAGAYGVSQSRKRAFIWAAAPGEILPEWPEPMHVFAAPELKIALSQNMHYAAVRSTSGGAPFRAITVRDTIGDLPEVENGATQTTLEYESGPISWFQKKIRGKAVILTDHISKEMNELNLIRCERIPKRPGADWRDLPDEKVKLSSGQVADLIPWCLPNTAERHNQWKGLFGRLDWEGNFPTSITDPQPMGKVGMCFHPDQDRILTVRECARSQGFPDEYQFAGNIQHKHRQIGNAVPPPLAYALGLKLKEAVESKKSSPPS
ncbi:hypothetical protein SAY87_024584 [Trapa incisa]|uniref:DNA (cytosine-5)-methyltransferase n=1 Tax=Trapa incisa TaxID=236973 RepID=A0AAN7G9V5_9MYRT|nr:hypothetical protein SAY87_024584 [Trapa incisa]